MTDGMEFDDLNPVQAPDRIDEIAPAPINEGKRGRGRPPRDPSAPRAPRRTAARGRKSLETQIGATLALLNLGVMLMPAPWNADALDETEIVALAKALDAAALQNPTMHKYLSAAMVEGGAMAGLITVAAIIGGRRLARHGILDESFDERLAGMLVMVGSTS
jgi:hypothetical protein